MYIATGMPPRRLATLPTLAITCFLSFPRCCAIRYEETILLEYLNSNF
jgi:hypothetical protein